MDNRDHDLQVILDYYRHAAEAVGAKAGPRAGSAPEQEDYSLLRFIPTSARQLNDLTRAYLGDEAAMEALPWAEGRQLAESEELKAQVKTYALLPNLGPTQVTAICRAIAGPVSIIQGPPGTGKSELIVNLLACIHALYPERTVAMVSCNNSAVDNVLEKLLKKANGSVPGAEELLNVFSYLGSRKRRECWLENCPGLEEDLKKTDDQVRLSAQYLARRPIFTSTVNSMRDCFTEEVSQFDYVIMDESSQVSCLQGLVALNCAKRLVLLGDEMQLPPVITKTHAGAAEDWPQIPSAYRDREGHSFLSACGECFPRAASTLLNVHFRCHRGIMDFFARYYPDEQGKPALRIDLEQHGKDEGCPIFVRWYEGDYMEELGQTTITRDGKVFARINREKAKVEYNSPKYAKKEETRSATVNNRQLEVFLREELPGLIQRLKANKRLSVSILCPYVYPLDRLREQLKKEKEFQVILDPENGDRMFSLSVNEAQGQDFNIVYYLPVEDAGDMWHWPISQEKRRINVALSRAMDEFHVICSSVWLPEEVQQTELGYVLPIPHPNDGDDENQLQLAALIRYAWENGGTLERSGLHSIFDRIPQVRRTGNRDNSAPELCLRETLYRLVSQQRFTVLESVPLRQLLPPELREPDALEAQLAPRLAEANQTSFTAAELREFLLKPGSHADFLLLGQDGLARFVEVDGIRHRMFVDEDYRGKDKRLRKIARQKRNDRMKDFWLREVLGATLLRLPTDGSSLNEEERLLTLVEEPGVPVNEAELRLDRIMDRLWQRIRTCTETLEARTKRADGEAWLHALALASRGEVPAAPSFHDLPAGLAWLYVCRDAMADGYGYIQLCRELLRDDRRVECARSLGVYSLGCGSLLDAWALAYAKWDLASGSGANRVKPALYWKGTDRAQPPVQFIAPKRSQGTVEDATRQDALSRYFLQLSLSWGAEAGDPAHFLREELQRPNSTYRAFLFPQSLSRLSPGETDALTETLAWALDNGKLPLDHYYLGVSWGRDWDLTGQLALSKLVRVFLDRGFRQTDVLASRETSMLREDMEALSPEEPLEDAAAALLDRLRRDFTLRDSLIPVSRWQTLREALEIQDAQARKAALAEAVRNLRGSGQEGELFNLLLRRMPTEAATDFDQNLLAYCRELEFPELLEAWRSAPDLPPRYQAKDEDRNITSRDPRFIEHAHDPDTIGHARSLISDLIMREPALIYRTRFYQTGICLQLIRLDRIGEA